MQRAERPKPVAAIEAMRRESSAPSVCHLARSRTWPVLGLACLAKKRQPRRWMSSSRASSAGVRTRGAAAKAGQDGARAEAASSFRSERRSIDFADFGPSGFLIGLYTPPSPHLMPKYVFERT